jgi:hypothetical protein
MPTDPTDELIELLRGIRPDDPTHTERIAAFQSLLWDGDRGWCIASERMDELFRDISHDLDLYESNPDVRRKDPSNYGPDRLEREVQRALSKIRAIHVTERGRPSAT